MIEKVDIAEFFVIAGAVTGVEPTKLRRASNVPMAESAIAAPFAGYGATLFYEDPIDRAAILCSRIVRNHPLPDGNKRTGYLAMKVLLDKSGIAWSIPNEDDAVTNVQALAAGTIDEQRFIRWVHTNCRLL